MNIKRIPPFVIFPDGFLANTKSENEFKVWIISQALWKRDDFKEDSIESVIQYYSPIEKLETFLETQFQFFLIRNSLNCQFSQNQFIDLIRSWLTSIAGKFPLNSFELILSLQSLNSKSTLSSQYGKYYYSYSSYIEYVRSWNNCTVDLITWKKFKFLSIPRDLSFLKPVFDKEGGLRFSETYMRKLFDEYVEDIYSSKFLLRLENKLIVEKDKYAIDKVLFNTGNEDDKKYLNQLCTNFYSWRILSTNLSKCLLNSIYNSELDINSQSSFAGYFALLKYYEVLNAANPTQNKQIDKVSIKPFFNLQTNFNIENSGVDYIKDLFYSLRDHFNLISKETRLSQFRNLFTDCELINKIEVMDTKKMVAIIKFLKEKNIIKPHSQYMVKFSECFIEENGKNIDVDYIRGSKHTLTLMEEKQLKNLFKTTTS